MSERPTIVDPLPSLNEKQHNVGTLSDERILKRSGGRLASIDAFRYFSFIAIAVLHTIGLPHVSRTAPYFYVNEATRFAVPFFFMTSGYFLASRQGTTPHETLRLLKRLVPVFLFWVFVYVIAKKQLSSLLHIRSLLHILLTGGPAYHLWFLPALGIAAAMTLAMRKFYSWIQWTIAVGFYFTGLIFGPYRFLLGQGFLAPFNTRNGPFFGLLFLLAGFFISKASALPRLTVSLMLAIGGFCLQLAECLLIARASHTPMTYHDCLIGTFPFGVGVFLVALNLKNANLPRILTSMGRLALGMYCIHVLWLKLVSDFIPGGSAYGVLATVIATVLLSTLSVMFLARVPGMRNLIQ